MALRSGPMQVAMLRSVDEIGIETMPIPTLRSGELLVRTRAAGICSGDIMAWYVARKAPLVLGHEPAGEIVEVGPGDAPRDENGKRFVVGDRVFVHHHAPCFSCDACARKHYVQCATWRATRIDPGAIAQYFRVPRENVRDTLRLPAKLAFVEGSLVEPLACVVKSLRRGGLVESDRVLCIGLGVMGLMHVALAVQRAAHVIGSDPIAQRRAVAQRFGATAVTPEELPAALAAIGDGSGADLVICGPGTPQALKAAQAACAPGGRIVMFAPLEPGAQFDLDPANFYFGDRQLIASYSCGPDDTRAALALLAADIVSAERLGATLHPFEEVAVAYADLRAARCIKPILTF
ncbi:MAG TPA: alcohol dehydrogenase catalytic domain-containing protein [Candidatus Dormibacteraeota bacterium]|nr:alcohol dehydrogenase catalytic domain-containing protein [Candidatus Dormibacteraeota bacterium]